MCESETLAAYLAGHIDSDGSIGISANGAKARTHRLRVSLYNNCGETLAEIQRAFGGSLHVRAATANRMARRDQYVLVWQARAAATMLPRVLPYLRTKRDQALLALEFQERNARDGHNGHANRLWQRTYYDRMRALNARHRGSLDDNGDPIIITEQDEPWKARLPERVKAGNPMARLTPAQVIEIRAAYGVNGTRLVDLAERFGVSPSLISKIVNRKLWAHVA